MASCFRLGLAVLIALAPPPAVACAIPDPASPPHLRASSFKDNQEEMTMHLEIQIEELRAELRNAVDAGERCQITAELEMLRAELAVIASDQDKTIERVPPL